MNTNELKERAEQIVKSNNEREIAMQKIAPEFVGHIEFTGDIRADGLFVELVPNEHNPALMDVARITRIVRKTLKDFGAEVSDFKNTDELLDFLAAQDIARGFGQAIVEDMAEWTDDWLEQLKEPK